MLLTRPGVLLGNRYLLQQRIGAGGMGEVWRAEDTMLRRPVALKVLHAALADDESFRLRFVQEARTVAALNAPGVVDVYDIRSEHTADGEAFAYLVMEFLEGRSLHSLIGSLAPMPAHRVLPLIAQVADALDAAHRAGIVHRDIKPANIIVDTKGAPTILDFGIALRSDQTALTATGTVLGTVGYASPEQLRGEELTGASDLYSLGVVAYECLSGALPFDRNSPAAVITGHLHETPPPLPAGVPSGVADLVDWVMAKDPVDRPATAGMFAQECRVAVSQARPVAQESNRTTVDLLVTSSPPPRATAPMPLAVASEEPKRRRGRGVLLGLAAVISAVAVTIGVMHFFDRDEPGGQSAGEDPTGGEGSSSSPEATEPSTAEETRAEEPPLPDMSVLVSAATGDCLIGYFDTPPPSARMGLCDDNGIDEFAFTVEGDEVSLTHSYEFTSGPDSSETITECLWWDGEYLNLAEHCGETTWHFTYLRTDEEEHADFWQVRASGDGNYCLDVPDEPNTAEGHYSPVINPCSEGDTGQEWRTAAE
ncbi:serine/threonine-protein kinase [Glycomyces rhizosphaerae]|uniref:non-specific serine/threonine protein kinase n=1 Tax=Glycomyces rhizosphaerae TaxID=2054422 RepID=A0ABV7Q0R3_9ACTN